MYLLGGRSYRQDQGCVSAELMGDFEAEKGCRPLKKDTLQTSNGKSLGDIKGPKKLFVINMYYTSSQVKRAVWNGCGDVSSTHCEHGYLIICRPACLVPTNTQLLIFFCFLRKKGKRNKELLFWFLYALLFRNPLISFRQMNIEYLCFNSIANLNL